MMWPIILAWFIPVVLKVNFTTIVKSKNFRKLLSEFNLVPQYLDEFPIFFRYLREYRNSLLYSLDNAKQKLIGEDSIKLIKFKKVSNVNLTCDKG